MQQFTITSDNHRQVLDITGAVESRLPQTGNGLAVVFTPHTGVALTTANLDPGTELDLLDFLKAMTPQLDWRHPHDPTHAPDHLLASLIGPSVQVPYRDGKLLTGTWQYVVMLELDGPRERTLILSFGVT